MDLGDIRQQSIENRWESDYIINMSEINNEAVLFAGKTRLVAIFINELILNKYIVAGNSQ